MQHPHATQTAIASVGRAAAVREDSYSLSGRPNVHWRRSGYSMHCERQRCTGPGPGHPPHHQPRPSTAPRAPRRFAALLRLAHPPRHLPPIAIPIYGLCPRRPQRAPAVPARRRVAHERRQRGLRTASQTSKASQRHGGEREPAVRVPDQDPGHLVRRVWVRTETPDQPQQRFPAHQPGEGGGGEKGDRGEGGSDEEEDERNKRVDEDEDEDGDG
eukprot:4700965-Pyramimonas_sp.AAC.1